VLRRIFGPKRDEVMGELRKLLCGELHNLYSSPNIVRQNKPRRMKWQGMGRALERREKHRRFWWESLKERDHSEE
jgi:hypothetical protein